MSISGLNILQYYNQLTHNVSKTDWFNHYECGISMASIQFEKSDPNLKNASAEWINKLGQFHLMRSG